MCKSLRISSLFLLMSCLFLLTYCSEESVEPIVTVHYLGHSSFILSFDNGVSILTDYGASRAWGLDSPIYDIGELVPDVVTYSHTEHEDHYGREIPGGVKHVLKNGESLNFNDIDIDPIRTSEISLDNKNNSSYQFKYKGVSILHLGDAQANIKAIQEDDNQQHLSEILPKNLDLLLMTIEGRTQFIAEAEEFIRLIRPKRVIPMHYWSNDYKLGFLDYLREQNRANSGQYKIIEQNSSNYSYPNTKVQKGKIEVVSLHSGQFTGLNNH